MSKLPDRPMFLEAGARAAPAELNDDNQPREAKSSLNGARRDFVFFLPYLPWAALGPNAVDPISVLEANHTRLTGRYSPVPQFFWRAPYELITNLKSLREQGFNTNQLFGVPMRYGKALLETVPGILVRNPVLGLNSYYALQQVWLFDWTYKTSKPIDDLSVLKIPVYAWVLQFSTGTIHATT